MSFIRNLASKRNKKSKDVQPKTLEDDSTPASPPPQRSKNMASSPEETDSVTSVPTPVPTPWLPENISAHLHETQPVPPLHVEPQPVPPLPVPGLSLDFQRKTPYQTIQSFETQSLKVDPPIFYHYQPISTTPQLRQKFFEAPEGHVFVANESRAITTTIFDENQRRKPIETPNSLALCKVNDKQQIRDQLVDEMTLDFIEKIRRDISVTVTNLTPVKEVSKRLESFTGGNVKADQAVYVFLGLFAIFPIFRNFPQLASLLSAFAYPAYKSFQAMNANSMDFMKEWLSYWIVLAAFQVLNFWGGAILSLFPFYWLVECLFYLWLSSPYTRGAQNLYKVIFAK